MQPIHLVFFHIIILLFSISLYVTPSFLRHNPNDNHGVVFVTFENGSHIPSTVYYNFDQMFDSVYNYRHNTTVPIGIYSVNAPKTDDNYTSVLGWNIFNIILLVVLFFIYTQFDLVISARVFMYVSMIFLLVTIIMNFVAHTSDNLMNEFFMQPRYDIRGKAHVRRINLREDLAIFDIHSQSDIINSIIFAYEARAKGLCATFLVLDQFTKIVSIGVSKIVTVVITSCGLLMLIISCLCMIFDGKSTEETPLSNPGEIQQTVDQVIPNENLTINT